MATHHFQICQFFYTEVMGTCCLSEIRKEGRKLEGAGITIFLKMSTVSVVVCVCTVIQDSVWFSWVFPPQNFIVF